MVTSSASRVITALRFPLMVGVIFIHSGISSGGGHLYLIVLSGFLRLFFRNFAYRYFWSFRGTFFSEPVILFQEQIISVR